MKKSFLFILALSATVAFSSCAKKCICTYYEEGKKVSTWQDMGAINYKSYTKDLCDGDKKLNWSEKEVTSIVNENKKVSAEQKCKLQ